MFVRDRLWLRLCWPARPLCVNYCIDSNRIFLNDKNRQLHINRWLHTGNKICYLRWFTRQAFDHLLLIFYQRSRPTAYSGALHILFVLCCIVTRYRRKRHNCCKSMEYSVDNLLKNSSVLYQLRYTALDTFHGSCFT